MEILQGTDEGALYWFENHHAPWLTPLMKAMTLLGEPKMILALTLGTAFVFFLGKKPRTATIVLLTALLAFLLGDTVKRWVDRPRPDVAWKMIRLPKDKSFPSGHALNSMADFGTVALIVARRVTRRALRRLVIGLGSSLPLLIGLSRPYLGVHYPSDVIGGWTAGLACALLAYWGDLRWGENRETTGAMDIKSLIASKNVDSDTGGHEQSGGDAIITEVVPASLFQYR
jgi:undecaprenyl-diphosphatase